MRFFSEVFGFSLPVRAVIPSLRRTHLLSGAGTIGPFGLLFQETLPPLLPQSDGRDFVGQSVCLSLGASVASKSITV